MEALSLDVLLEHADYARFALLSALLLFPRGRFVRLVVAVFAGLELAYGLATGADNTTIIWMSVLLGIAVLIMAADILSNRGVRLSQEEQAMTARLLKGVGRGRARHFIDQGYWLNAKPGEVLLREGEPVKEFCFLSSGEASVMMGGRAIGFCRDGDLIGGLGFFSGETAAATVMLATPARLWCAPAERLHRYFDAHEDLRRRVERSHGDAMPDEASEPESKSLPIDAATAPAA